MSSKSRGFQVRKWHCWDMRGSATRWDTVTCVTRVTCYGTRPQNAFSIFWKIISDTDVNHFSWQTKNNFLKLFLAIFLKESIWLNALQYFWKRSNCSTPYCLQITMIKLINNKGSLKKKCNIFYIGGGSRSVLVTLFFSSKSWSKMA